MSRTTLNIENNTSANTTPVINVKSLAIAESYCTMPADILVHVNMIDKVTSIGERGVAAAHNRDELKAEGFGLGKMCPECPHAWGLHPAQIVMQVKGGDCRRS